MSEFVSQRLIDQRCRNRIIEAVEMLAQCKGGELRDGEVNYIDFFFDWMDPDGQPHPNSAMSQSELKAVRDLACFLSEICTAAGRAGQRVFIAEEVLVASKARDVFNLMSIIGRLSDDVEQLE